MGFYRNKGAGARWCLRKCRSSVSHLRITFAWELRIYSRGSNCSHKGPEATSEGLAHRCLKGVQQPGGKEYIHLICLSWDFAVLVLRMNTVLRSQTALNRLSILTLALWATVPKHLWSQLLSMNSYTRFCASCIGRAVMKNRVWILSLGKCIIQLIYSINSRTACHTMVGTKLWPWGQNTVPKDSSLRTSFL